MWFDEAVIYQIYPLGLCGAPLVNNGECEEEAGNHRILRILDWIDHIKSMGTSCVLFNPLFESDAHGYDTRNYNKVDRRLGTNEDFKKLEENKKFLQWCGQVERTETLASGKKEE